VASLRAPRNHAPLSKSSSSLKGLPGQSHRDTAKLLLIKDMISQLDSLSRMQDSMDESIERADESAKRAHDEMNRKFKELKDSNKRQLQLLQDFRNSLIEQYKFPTDLSTTQPLQSSKAVKPREFMEQHSKAQNLPRTHPESTDSPTFWPLQHSQAIKPQESSKLLLQPLIFGGSVNQSCIHGSKEDPVSIKSRMRDSQSQPFGAPNCDLYIESTLSTNSAAILHASASPYLIGPEIRPCNPKVISHENVEPVLAGSDKVPGDTEPPDEAAQQQASEFEAGEKKELTENVSQQLESEEVHEKTHHYVLATIPSPTKQESLETQTSMAKRLSVNIKTLQVDERLTHESSRIRKHETTSRRLSGAQ
jgi:hypothetical protein